MDKYIKKVKGFFSKNEENSNSNIQKINDLKELEEDKRTILQKNIDNLREVISSLIAYENSVTLLSQKSQKYLHFKQLLFGDFILLREIFSQNFLGFDISKQSGIHLSLIQENGIGEIKLLNQYFNEKDKNVFKNLSNQKFYEINFQYILELLKNNYNNNYNDELKENSENITFLSNKIKSDLYDLNEYNITRFLQKIKKKYAQLNKSEKKYLNTFKEYVSEYQEIVLDCFNILDKDECNKIVGHKQMIKNNFSNWEKDFYFYFFTNNRDDCYKFLKLGLDYAHKMNKKKIWYKIISAYDMLDEKENSTKIKQYILNNFDSISEYERAELTLEIGKQQEARKLFEPIIKENIKDQDYSSAGDIYNLLGDSKQARKYYDLDITKSHRNSFEYLEKITSYDKDFKYLAQYYENILEKEKAQKVWLDMAEDYDGIEIRNYESALCYQSAGLKARPEFQRAFDYFKKLVEVDDHFKYA
jgi:hypothetical protein